MIGHLAIAKHIKLHIQTCALVLRSQSSFTGRMASKETPKKVYRSSSSSIDSSACRLCRAVGDTRHRKNIFKPSNRVLLETAEQICGHSIVYEANLPHLVCNPREVSLQ